MREESQRSEDEWWNKGKMGRQRRQMLLGYATSLRILTTVCLAFSCNDIFFVARSHDLSGFLPFGLTEVGVQLTPHNNQWALELNSSKSRTGRPTPLQYKSHTRRESGQCLFSSKSNFSYISSFCIFVEVWDPRADHLLVSHSYTHTHWARHWHTTDNLQQSVSMTSVCIQNILSCPEGVASRKGIYFPEKAEKFSFVLDT